ncbi:uncharacterized protein FPRO_14813 [Fusarium proliferatum ET1]|uniref:Uncharacterized protein n=1 Tax=Fusarium proliferatum (strain ET1) TaxID=1227346 RepID=A0A1L7WAR1_FUSPR|nr:uncharacterized protein FPRO_14813 [Fusarium proliferatum ET1]CZR49709.1 uncharacterized protein FPRO_14813 [Fusarium proliferatum ET1]
MHSGGHDSSAVRPVGVPLGEAAKPPRFQAYVTGEQPSSNNNIARASFQCNESATALGVPQRFKSYNFWCSLCDLYSSAKRGNKLRTFPFQNRASREWPNSRRAKRVLPSRRTPGGKSSPPQLRPPGQPSLIPTRSDTPSDETPAPELEITERGKLETEADELRARFIDHTPETNWDKLPAWILVWELAARKQRHGKLRAAEPDWEKENLSTDRQYDQTLPTAESQISDESLRIIRGNETRATDLYLRGREPEMAAGKWQTSGTGISEDLEKLPVTESDLVESTGWKKSGTTWETLGVGGVTGRIPQKAGMALAGGGW